MIKEALIGSCEDEILADCRTALEKHRFSEDEIDLYLSYVGNVLNYYRECFGGDTKLEYHVRKRFNRIELRLVVQGEKVNPLEWVKERGDTGQSVEQALSPLVWNQTDLGFKIILSPLLEGNIPQLVVLRLALGAALLMLEDKVDGLKDILSQVSKWSMSLMGIVMIIVPIILVLELSIASPGTTGGWTILFAALALPADYVGMFMTYRLACTNYNAAYGALQVGLEQIEAAYEFDAINLDQLRTE